jgi:hypothetical protein
VKARARTKGKESVDDSDAVFAQAHEPSVSTEMPRLFGAGVLPRTLRRSHSPCCSPVLEMSVGFRFLDYSSHPSSISIGNRCPVAVLLIDDTPRTQLDNGEIKKRRSSCMPTPLRCIPPIGCGHQPTLRQSPRLARDNSQCMSSVDAPAGA